MIPQIFPENVAKEAAASARHVLTRGKTSGTLVLRAEIFYADLEGLGRNYANFPEP